jgi:hypothetical protein
VNSKKNDLSLTPVDGDGFRRSSVMGFEEDEASAFIDKYLKEEGGDSDEEDEAFTASKIDREGYLDRKFSVKQIGVIKNFSYKNLVRLHSRNKAQMQRQSFFLRAGGRSRFGAASETLVSGHHRISAPQREH